MRTDKQWAADALDFLRAVLQENVREVVEDLLLHDPDCPTYQRSAQLVALCGFTPAEVVHQWMSR